MVLSRTVRVFVTLCICWIELGNPRKVQVPLIPVEGNDCQLASNCSNDKATVLENPNLAVHYTSRDNLKRLLRYQAHKRRKRGPFRTFANNLTDTFSPSEIFFKIYTSKNGIKSPKMVKYGGLRLKKMTAAGFNPKTLTKIAIHGFQSDSGEMEGLAKAVLSNPKTKNTNVILLDWSEITKDFDYFKIANLVPKVGKNVGRTLGKILVKNLSMNPNKIHIIGHSLGAHIASHMARSIEENGMKGKVGRVTGLDPAAPWFDIVGGHLTKNDAKLVDVIHTQCGSLLEGGLSFCKPLGHIDFYPNGGKMQPGCSQAGLIFLVVDALIGGGACSHSRSIKYYTESAKAKYNNKAAFLSWPEGKSRASRHKVQMGERLDKSKVGRHQKYYLDVLPHEPWTV